MPIGQSRVNLKIVDYSVGDSLLNYGCPETRTSCKFIVSTNYRYIVVKIADE